MIYIKRSRTCLFHFINQQRFWLLGCVKNESSSQDEPNDQGTRKFDLEIDKEVEKGFLQDNFIAKNHPGVMNTKCVYLPSALMEAIGVIMEEKKYPDKALQIHSSNFLSYIWCRNPPCEETEMRKILDEEAMKFVNTGQLRPSIIEEGNQQDIQDLTPGEKKLLGNKLKQKLYNWKPIEYDSYMSHIYMSTRLAPDYAALVRILGEIKRRRKDFVPKTMFDFGSGVGSVTWAVDTIWPEMCKEYYNVDASVSMNGLAELLLKGGISTNPGPPQMKSTYYRQFLPASNILQYDLVVSSRSFFELSSLNVRARTVDILWRKVALGGYLVLVEAGTKFGYTLLLELRDYLLEINKVEREKYSIDTPIHVFSPCPHDMFCPRFYHRSGKPCYFTTNFQSLLTSAFQIEAFSYLVLQKQERKTDEEWPRIVEPVMKRHFHIVNRVCTTEGSIRELTVTRGKHGVPCYKICKASKWGDLLPVNLNVKFNKKDSSDDNNPPCREEQETSEEEVIGDQSSEERPKDEKEFVNVVS